jgi:lipid-A-disaccharide synthase
MTRPTTLCIVAGEASGDAHAGGLVAAFRALSPGCEWFGAGGPGLIAAGAEVLVSMENLAVVGVAEVFSHLPALWRAMAHLKAAIRERKPDALVLVDFPDFNFRLATFASRLGIPVLYYITPQVWAWRPGRVKFLKRHVKRALVILPFEEAFLRERGMDAVFVGHPLAGMVAAPSDRVAFRARHGVEPGAPCVALLPGSRRSEVRRNLPALLDAARLLTRTFPEAHFFVPWAPSLQVEPPGAEEASPVRFVRGEYLDVLGHADAAAVASGTATLEAALLGVPQVVVYRLQPLTFAIGRRLVQLDHVALPNVVLGRHAVPELLQGDFTAQNVARKLEDYLADSETARASAARLSEELRSALGGGDAYRRAAEEVLKAVSG